MVSNLIHRLQLQPLRIALQNYEQALNGLQNDSQKLLSCLLARDQVDVAFQQVRMPNGSHLPDTTLNKLVEQDARLRQFASTCTLDELSGLSNWRESRRPPDGYWWWFLDQAREREEEEKQNAQKGVRWILLNIIFLFFTILLFGDLTQRLWEGGPEAISGVITLFSLLLASSTLTEKGRELLVRAFDRVHPRIPYLNGLRRAKAIAWMAFIAFVFVGIGWWLRPQLSTYYNNQGNHALREGHLTDAQSNLVRAVALDANNVVAYQNLADVYQRIGRLEEAESWYQKAIEVDMKFGPAYRGLGHLYNLRGEWSQAEQVLLAGLDRQQDTGDDTLETVTHYQLLSDLGWTYFAQEKLELAQMTLEAAIEQEEKVKKLEDESGRSYIALPHFYLAQIYEGLERHEDAQEQWKTCLHLLNSNYWANKEWNAIVLKHLER